MSAALFLVDLERGDRAAELHAHLGVGQRILAQPLGAAHHLVGEQDGGLDCMVRANGAAAPPASPSSRAVDAS